MIKPQEYRVQFSFVALQSLLIVGGTLLCGISLKTMLKQFDPDNTGSLYFLKFVSYYGFLLLVIPTAWAYLTIKAESIGYMWANRRTIFISGFLLIVALAFLYFTTWQRIMWLPLMDDFHVKG